MLKEKCTPSSLYVHNNSEFSYRNEDDTMFYLNVKTGTDRKISDEEFFEVFNLYSDEKPVLYAAPVVKQPDPNFNKVYNKYPNGSYFTTTGTACVNHNHCKTYSGAIQCVGFAKYAYNAYANQPQWGTIAAERFDGDVTFSTTNNQDIRNYFAGCAPLTIVYVCRPGRYEYHIITVVSITNSTIKVYDCNWTNDCKVRLVNMTYDSYRYMSPSSSYFSTHKYSTKCVYKDSQTHIQYCDNAGCNGYRLEYHYNLNTSAGVCLGCGASANIQYTEPLPTSLIQ